MVNSANSRKAARGVTHTLKRAVKFLKSTVNIGWASRFEHRMLMIVYEHPMFKILIPMFNKFTLAVLRELTDRKSNITSKNPQNQKVFYKTHENSNKLSAML